MKHITKIRTTYKDTDQMGVVYYANYLIWFEIARTEFFRDKGVVYKDIEKDHKIFLPVIDVHCRYKAPVRYDDIVEIHTEIEEMKKTKLSFKYEVMVNGSLCAEGNTKHVFIDSNRKPVSIPENIKKALIS